MEEIKKEKTMDESAEELSKGGSPKENPNLGEGNKEQIKEEDKQLKILAFVIGGILVAFLLSYFFIGSLGNFKYKNLDFKVVEEGSLLFYNTNFPVYNRVTGKVAGDYNFYFRNDPRKLEKDVPIEEEIMFRKNLVLDLTTEDLFCEGDWNLAMGNLMKLDLFGINILIKNNSLEYTPSNEFLFMTINKGNQTEINKLDSNSYEMNVNDCEILKVVERLMIESIVKHTEINKLN